MTGVVMLLLATVLDSYGAPMTGARVQTQFQKSSVVALVQVTNSTFPAGYDVLTDLKTFSEASATLVVIAAWKGPYRAGQTLRAGQPDLCAGWPCVTYPFQVGEVLLVFLNSPRSRYLPLGSM
jgi:hypothetical protein